jgi:acyl-coenzyme A synthetase/AMP-(fatty) acid ligase
LYPNRAGYASLTQKVSFTALANSAKQMAGMLRHRGVKPGDVVAIDLPVLTFTVASFAVFHEAGVVMTYNRSAATAGVHFDWLLTNSPTPGVPSDRQIVLDTNWLRQMQRESLTMLPNEYPSKDSVMRILYTSGTTGTPKAVAFTVESALERALSNQAVARAGRDLLVSLFRPTGGPAGWYQWYASFVHQTTYVFAENAIEAVQLFERHNVPAVFGSPTHIRDIASVLRARGITLPALRLIEYSGGPLPLRVFDELESLTTATVGGTLGTSEVGSITHLVGRPSSLGHVGTILDFVDVEVVDEETGERVEDGTTGILRFRRDIMATEYVGDGASSNTVFRDGWFYPGDIGRREGNELFIDGRSSERFNVGGIKIAPTALDSAFLAMDGIDDCAAFAISSSDDLDQIHVAYVADTDLSNEMLTELGDRATKGVGVTQFHRVDTIPRNEMGKPLRRELTERFG